MKLSVLSSVIIGFHLLVSTCLADGITQCNAGTGVALTEGYTEHTNGGHEVMDVTDGHWEFHSRVHENPSIDSLINNNVRTMTFDIVFFDSKHLVVDVGSNIHCHHSVASGHIVTAVRVKL
jgi:hypothetical protein